VALYHPLRWQKASCTFPPVSLVLMLVLMFAVRATLSTQREAPIQWCKQRPPVWHRQPLWRSIAQWAVNHHVSANIQLFHNHFVGSVSLHVALCVPTFRVSWSCSSTGGSCRRNIWWLRRYCFSHPICPLEIIVTMARWSKSCYHGCQNAMFQNAFMSPSLAIM
jgi:hypothetical protein